MSIKIKKPQTNSSSNKNKLKIRSIGIYWYQKNNTIICMDDIKKILHKNVINKKHTINSKFVNQ